MISRKCLILFSEELEQILEVFGGWLGIIALHTLVS
jgi:hypothetical protein